MTITDLTILERDNYQCRSCGRGGENVLHAHHQVYRSQGGSDDASNQITLCGRCHEKIHNDPSILTIVIDSNGYPLVFIRRR